MKPLLTLVLIFSFVFLRNLHAQTNEALIDSIIKLTSKEIPQSNQKKTAEEKEHNIILSYKLINIGYERALKDKDINPVFKAFFLFKKGGLIRETSNDIEQAWDLIDKAFKILKSDSQNIAQMPFLYGEILTKKGYFIYYYQHDLQRAEEFYLEAIDTYIPKDSVYAYSSILLNLTYIYRDKNNFSKAKEYALAFQDMRKAYGPSNYYYISSLNNLATLYEYFEYYDIAEEYYLQAKEAIVDKEKSVYNQYLEILNNLGVLYMNIGRYDEAENYLQQVNEADLIAINKQDKKNINKEDYALSCHNLALVFYHKKNIKKAHQYLDICLNIEANIYGKNSLNYTRSLRTLADLYLQENHFGQALIVYKNILNIYQPYLSKADYVSKEYLSILKGLAILYERWKLYDKSLEYYIQVVELQEKMETKGQSLYLNSLINLSRAYAATKDFKKAEILIQEAIKLNAKGNIKDTILLEALEKEEWIFPRLATLALSVYAQNIMDQSNAQNQDNELINKGYVLIKKAIEINKKHRTEFWSDKDKFFLLEVNYQYTKLALSIGQKVTAIKDFNKEAFYLIENNKAALLSEGIKTHQAHKFLPKELADKENDLTWKYSLALRALADANSTEDRASIQNRLGQIQEEIYQLKQALEEKYPKYYAFKYGNYIADFDSIKAGLKDNELMIQYFIGTDHTYILGITNKSSKLFYSPINEAILQDSVRKMKTYLTSFELIRNSPEKAYTNYTNLAHWFYIALLKNTLEHFPEHKELIIIPDTHLGLLPFEVFLSKSADKNEINYGNLPYIINEYDIVYHYSASLWQSHNNQAPKSMLNSGKILAMGGSYNENIIPAKERSSQIQAIRKSLKPLSSVNIELAAIEKIYKGDFVMNEKSTEAYFKNNASEQDIIHLAMHAMGNKNNTMLSSLYFTESNDEKEDNILEAWEIMQMQLNASLVVLSACESGVGVYLRGDGVSSLARSFMYAGANSLLVSLWKVNDQSTAAIMQNYYTFLAKNITKSKALRQAKLKYLSTYKDEVLHPAYWAAFIQIGDNKPILPKKNYTMYYIALGATMIFISGFLFYRKRVKKIA